MFNIQLFVLNKSKYYINKDNINEPQYLTKKQNKHERKKLTLNLHTVKIIQQFNEISNIKVTMTL